MNFFIEIIINSLTISILKRNHYKLIFYKRNKLKINFLFNFYFFLSSIVSLFLYKKIYISPYTKGIFVLIEFLCLYKIISPQLKVYKLIMET